MSTLAANLITDVAGTNSPAFTRGELCRARFNLDGTGTIAERDSFNVSSYTDNGTGDYTATFTTAFPNANYSFPLGGNGDTTLGTFAYPTANAPVSGGYTPTTTTLRVRGVNGANAAIDFNTMTCAVHGDRV